MSFSNYKNAEELARMLVNLFPGDADEVVTDPGRRPDVPLEDSSITNGHDGSQDGPPVLWLEPECCADPGIGRTWCQDEHVFECEEGRKPVRYIRADLVREMK